MTTQFNVLQSRNIVLTRNFSLFHFKEEALHFNGNMICSIPKGYLPLDLKPIEIMKKLYTLLVTGILLPSLDTVPEPLDRITEDLRMGINEVSEQYLNIPMRYEDCDEESHFNFIQVPFDDGEYVDRQSDDTYRTFELYATVAERGQRRVKVVHHEEVKHPFIRDNENVDIKPVKDTLVHHFVIKEGVIYNNLDFLLDNIH